MEGLGHREDKTGSKTLFIKTMTVNSISPSKIHYIFLKKEKPNA